ncbi:MAG: hypothetical protein ACREP9_04865 [Candidatus Dormibacteraceae bacterium]
MRSSLSPGTLMTIPEWRATLTLQSRHLPHDWAVELPFQNGTDLSSKGFCPLGRKYPATSVGWYRRVLDHHCYDQSLGSSGSGCGERSHTNHVDFQRILRVRDSIEANELEAALQNENATLL